MQFPYSMAINCNKWKKRIHKNYFDYKLQFWGNRIHVFVFFVGPEGAELNVSWTPKVIDPDKSIKLYFNIKNRKI